MRTLLKKSLVPIFLICAIIFTQHPADATAGWKRKENLPGLVSTKSVILIGVGTAGAIFLLAKFSKSGKASKAKAEESRSLEHRAPNSSNPKSYAQSSDQRRASAPRVALFVDVNDYGVKGIDSFERRLNFKNKTISVGLSLGL